MRGTHRTMRMLFCLPYLCLDKPFWRIAICKSLVIWHNTWYQLVCFVEDISKADTERPYNSGVIYSSQRVRNSHTTSVRQIWAIKADEMTRLSFVLLQWCDSSFYFVIFLLSDFWRIEAHAAAVRDVCKVHVLLKLSHDSWRHTMHDE